MITESKLSIARQTKRQPGVTFVLVNWNQCRLTLDCLASLQRQHYYNFRVTLVDNGSHDDSVAAIREAYPETVIYANPTNLGIAAANNIGIRHALAHNSAYIFLLNNDTIVHQDMLQQLVEVAEAEPSVGMAGPTMLYFDKPDTVWCAGNQINWWTGATVRRDADRPLSEVAGEPCREVDFITSCAVLIKSAVFRQVGLMDERFFIYYDETDWFARATTGGWRTVYVPWARMWHKVSAAMGATSPATEYYMSRNVLLFLAKHTRGRQRAVSLVLATCRSLLAIFAYTVKLQGGQRQRNRDVRLRALRDAVLAHWGKMGPDVEAICYPGRR